MGVVPAAGVDRFGKYSLVARLATGGMAEIFLARLEGAGGFSKLVCIKRILPHLAKDQQLVGMFLAEARIAAQISHPNVCQVFELGEIDGRYFIAMEYLEGVPLSCFRRRDMYPGEPDPRLVATLGIQACEGLHHAHLLKRPDGSSLEVVHRDVSSNNLFSTVDGVVKVLDFGIAKVQDATVRTSTGSVKGTYAYMAPEQLRNEAIDRRTDVFAMGIVLWELFARRHLFRRDTDYLTFQAITSDPIPPVAAMRPDVPPALADAIGCALSRDRDERFPTARALGEALAHAIAPLGGPLSSGQLGDEVIHSFEPRLRDQRALIRLAREGGALDLTQDVGPAVGHGTAMLTTPVSIISAHGAAPTTVDPPAPPPPAPRSLTLPVPPLPLAPRRSRLAIVLVVLLALGAGAAGAYVWLQQQAAREPRIAGADTPGGAGATGTGAAPEVSGATTADAAPPLAADATPAVAADAAPDIAGADEPGAPPGTAGAGSAEEPPPDAAVPQSAAPPPPTRPDTRPPPRRPAGPPGFITIDSSPVYAVIFIDGKRYGETPLVRIELAPGKHSVRAVSESGSTRMLTITIEPGKLAPTRRIEW